MKHALAISLLLCICSGISYADDPSDGFLLIRILEVHTEANARIDLTHVDTGELVRIRSETCAKGSLDSRVCLVPAPAGRYFWSRFDLMYRLRQAESYLDGPSMRRTSPGSADDSVEIVANAVSYIGDWELDNADQSSTSFHRPKLSVDITQNPKTLEFFFEHFPDEAARYEVYLSMLGKQAMSLRDFLKLVEERS